MSTPAGCHRCPRSSRMFVFEKRGHTGWTASCATALNAGAASRHVHGLASAGAAQPKAVIDPQLDDLTGGVPPGTITAAVRADRAQRRHQPDRQCHGGTL
jgi:hypothetical protein